MRDDLEKRQETEAPAVYGGAYDAQIQNLYGQMQNREPFRYNVNGDALYQQYRDRYIQNARRSMKDTMGQAAALTGGYGSSYSQGAGQQAYDETLRGLTDVIPQLEERAYKRWKDQGDAILQQYTVANQLGAADQATRYAQRDWDFQQQQYADRQRQYADQQRQQAYGNLSAAILRSGYQPDPEELATAGMSQQQANALRQAWIGSNPAQAYVAGALDADGYFRLTGQQPPDVLAAQQAAAAAAAAAASSGGGRGSSALEFSQVSKQVQQRIKAGGEGNDRKSINDDIMKNSKLTPAQKRELIAKNTAYVNFKPGYDG